MGKKSLFVRTRERRTARLRRLRREELCNPIIDYLMVKQSEAETLDDQDHYKFYRRVVSMALEGWADPFVVAFYYHYGRHPDKLIPEWLQRQEYAKTLGPSLAELLNNLIPDYDPTSELIPRVSRPLAPVTIPDAADTREKPALAPYRLIVDRISTFANGQLAYYTERLQCGHSHIEFPGGNPGNRRQCKSCLIIGPTEHGAISSAFLRSCSGLGRLSWRT